ncbi:amidohydrolase family protein [Synechococcus sp. Nb3U1]|uniref:amidohydrolase family protein n=1 Tax=Synechococcus sp. Nb3U1 TaxID=1914529 RepID=UPI001F27D707|nr:amidohydrolase family protein [Synechococcus sp. Nb3U1]MCF2972720.1 amidohydrolase family protein [Synechococcus sp. Nb3U1]
MKKSRLVLVNGVLADGTPAGVAVDPVGGVIAAVGSVALFPEDEKIDCTGMVILPAAAEPHAHLDKALSSRLVPAMPVDLAAAVADWHHIWPTLTHEDLVQRASESVEAMVIRGVTAIRSHVDIGSGVGLRGLRALKDVKEQYRDLVDLQIVGLIAHPLVGDEGAEHRALLEEGIEEGLMDVVGGSPDLAPDPVETTRVSVVAAARSGLPLDLHTDQTVDPDFFYLPEMVRLVQEYGVKNVVASHCISLATQPEAVQEKVAAEVAEAGIAVTTMPLTSLFYFGWDQPVAPPRGVTAIAKLEAAGVVVAAGADNVRDLFFPYGRFDPVETATVLGMVAHFTPEHVWDLCSRAARKAMGLPEMTLAPGSPAELLVIQGRHLTDALADGSERRIVLHRGRVVANTSVQKQLIRA